MGSRNPLYRVSVSSSGLIYAVIVGAWAAYLVPMWLRRQDELNEARPTERFSTAIRLLSGKAGMERRYAREAERRETRDAPEADDPPSPASRASSEGEPGGYDDDANRNDPDADVAVDVRAFADPKTMINAHGAGRHGSEAHTEARAPHAESAHGRARPGEFARERDEPGQEADRDRKPRPGHVSATGAGGNALLEAKRAKQEKRARLLARRRRTTMMLFLTFSVGTVVAAVGGLAFLWVPAVPAALLSAYIAHLRGQERRRFTFTMDRRRAEDAARNLRERRPRPGAARNTHGGRDHAPDQDPDSGPPSRPGHGGRDRTREPRAGRGHAPDGAGDGRRGAAREPQGVRAELRPDARQEARARAEEQEAAERRALVEQTDHAEWVDQQRAPDRENPEGEGWEPVPVPLPTYVSAPVAPRTNRSVDLEAPDAWSSARSSTAPATQSSPPAPEPAAEDQPARPRRTRDRSRTPLFDQYEDDERPRAANE